MTSPRQSIDRWGQGRQYVHPITGKVYPSVTAILQRLHKPAIAPWTGKMVAEYAADHVHLLHELGKKAWVDLCKKEATRYTAEAADLGSAVHTAVERYAANEDVNPDDFAEDVRPFIRAYVDFLDTWQPTYQLLEATVYNGQHGYAGTLDAVVDLPLGRLLLDVKTGRSGPWPEAGLQCAAYRNAETYVVGPPWQEHAMIPTEGAAILKLRPNEFALIPVESGPDVFLAFRALIAVDKFQSTVAPDVVGLPLAPPQRKAAP